MEVNNTRVFQGYAQYATQSTNTKTNSPQQTQSQSATANVGEAFELDISALAPAWYQMIYTFFRRDGYGNSEDLECRWGLCFYVKESPASIVWDTRNWGYHLLRGAELKRLKVTEEEEQHAGSQSDSASL